MNRQAFQWVALVALAMGCGLATAQEPLLLSKEAGGVLELEGESRLEIRGISGRIIVRAGKAGEIRFAARDMEDAKVERGVALWLEGDVLRFTTAEGAEDLPLRLEVSVAPTLRTLLDVTNAVIDISGLQGAVEVVGDELSLTARSLGGSVDIELTNSDLVLVAATEPVRLDGKGLVARVENVPALTIKVEDGEVQIAHVRGQLDGDFENVDVTADNVIGGIQLDADGGSVTLSGTTAGGALRLTEAPLQLRLTKGTIEVDTDAEVRFIEHDGALTIRGRESAVIGGQSKGGALEIASSGAAVRLEQIEGATTIRGDRLDVQVSGTKELLTVKTTGSSVKVEKATAPVSIENDFGDIELHEMAKLVDVFSRDGKVHADGLKGPAQISADGPIVTVEWVAIEGTDTSSIENARGDVRVTIPGNVRCGLDLQAPYGRIESDIEAIGLSEDGHFGSAMLTGGRSAAPQVKKPTIQLKSGGDLYVFVGGPLAPAEQP